MRPQPPEPGTAGLPEFVLDGTSFDDLAGFFTAITRTLSLTSWGTNLDAFNDILRGGFGTPQGGFILRWASSATSAQRLGWPETIRYLENKLTTCHPANIPQRSGRPGRGPAQRRPDPLRHHHQHHPGTRPRRHRSRRQRPPHPHLSTTTPRWA
jgi:hypothetical protein